MQQFLEGYRKISKRAVSYGLILFKMCPLGLRDYCFYPSRGLENKMGGCQDLVSWDFRLTGTRELRGQDVEC